MISLTKKFIYIDIVKTASTSIRKILAKEGGIDKHHCFLNKTCVDNPLKRNISSDGTWLNHKLNLDEYYKFAFVRNPWDRLVSLFFFGEQQKRKWARLSFNAFATRECTNILDGIYNTNSKPMIEWIRDDDRNILVDYIGKFESLTTDWENVKLALNISNNLPHIKRSNHLNYRTYYTKELKKLVDQAYKEDIEFFNYSF